MARTLRASGKRPFLVSFERRTATRSGMGIEKPGPWVALCSAWVDILHGKGSERRDTAVEAASIAATFIANSTPLMRSLTEMDRIFWDGRGWDIQSIAPMGLNRTIEFTATVRKG
jgi:hypothetical protein